MFELQHCGLFFGNSNVERAHKYARREPFVAAFADLGARQARGIAAVQLDGLRCRFMSDEAAANKVKRALDSLVPPGIDPDRPLIDQIAEAITLAQIFEMVRDTTGHASRDRFLDGWWALASALSASSAGAGYVERLWLGLLTLTAGIVTERGESIDQGADVFRRVIAQDINPRGHIEPAVDGEDGGSMTRTLLAVSALVLMAEAASHVGVDLWSYEVRGVSIMTAALYPIYYFYVTDKWTWDTLTPEQVQAVFRRHGGYLEIVNHRAQPRDFKPLLEDLRPIYDPWAGGLTTLTHGVPARQGLFG